MLTQLTKIILERALEEERSEHLGYERGDPAGRGSGNSRNGTSPKRVLTELGPVDLDIPRDRAGTFEPQLVPKHATRLGRFNDNIVAWYSKGLSTRDIRRELRRMYGVEVSAELISRVTDGVVDELREWQARPLDACYPIVYIDALVVKVRTQGTVVNRPAYLGMVGSRRRGAAVLGYLADRGLPRDQLDRVRVPVGLDLGKTTHQEIAVAILAELVQLRAAGALGAGEHSAAEHSAAEDSAARHAAEALDPVCGMTVTADRSGRPLEHEGAAYYFCGAGCRSAFEKDPGAYVSEPEGLRGGPRGRAGNTVRKETRC